MYFDINLKLLSGKNTQKSEQTKYSGFVKLGVRWAERDITHEMCGSCHIQSVLIGIKYRNYRRTLGVYLLFAILLGQIKSKLNYRLLTYKLASP